MPDDRLDKVEIRLDAMHSDIRVLQADVSQLKTDVAELKVDVAGLKVDVAGLKIDVAEIRTDVAGLKVGFGDLRHYMGVIHEDLIDKIRATGAPEERLRGEFQTADKELRKEFDKRVGPLEAVARSHSKEIDDLKHQKRKTS